MEMNDLFFELFRMIAIIIGLVLAYYIIPCLKAMVAKHLDDNTADFIRMCVYAAQQTMTDNEDKKNYVLAQATEWLNQKDIHISEEQLDILIESAVLAMKTETR